MAKVFLASPGDLREERKVAKLLVDGFNSQFADTLGYHVDLVGWEDSLPNFGRPQSLINRDLEGCDQFYWDDLEALAGAPSVTGSPARIEALDGGDGSGADPRGWEGAPFRKRSIGDAREYQGPRVHLPAAGDVVLGTRVDQNLVGGAVSSVPSGLDSGLQSNISTWRRRAIFQT
jgi:hypothetical protein